MHPHLIFDCLLVVLMVGQLIAYAGLSLEVRDIYTHIRSRP